MKNDVGEQKTVNGIVREAKGQGDVTAVTLMGNPRNWLDTASGSIDPTCDSRCQSLPNCHDLNGTEIKKPAITPEASQESWFNTWPDKLHKSSENILESQKSETQKNGLTFSEALDRINFTYNPITKQLQLQDIKPELETPSPEKTKGHHRGASSFSSTVSTLSDPSSSGSLISHDELPPQKPKTFFRKVFSSTGSWRLFSNSKNPELISTALIPNLRPSELPAKDTDEDRRHRDEYEAILQAARRRDLETSKAKKRREERQLRQEEQLSNAAKYWSGVVLPQWDNLNNQKKVRDLWWQGLPPSVRGRIWILAIGNELNITSNLYNICLCRANDRLAQPEVSVSEHDLESSMNLIQLDISRTFPNLGIFQSGGPYYKILHQLLAAYVCYRPDVGYVQGMSFLAAILILNMEPIEAFICFANLINKNPLLLAAFTINQVDLNAYFNAYNQLFQENLPKLFAHFESVGLSPDLYLMDWIYTVFAKAMPLDLACRVWDLYLRDGDAFIFRTGLGVFHLYQEQLLKMDFLDGAQFLTRLPDDTSSDHLFRSIKSICVSSSKRTFPQLLDKCKESFKVS